MAHYQLIEQKSIEIIFFFSFLKNKKERLSKTTYFDNESKLKEHYVKICRNLNCFGCVLFTVKEILFDIIDSNNNPRSVSFKKVHFFEEKKTMFLLP